MDAKVLYWTGALINLGVIISLVVTAVRHVRRGDVARHRRNMLIACSLVGAFLGSYVLKVAFLGRERLSEWSEAHRVVLYVHETCVLLMLIAGAVALSQAWRMRKTRNVTRQPGDSLAPESTRRWHRRAGWSAAFGSALGLLTAAVVLAGMVARL